MPPADILAASPDASSRNERNHLLDLLSGSVYDAVVSQCELVSFKARDVVYEPYQPIVRVHFPTSCVLSIVKLMSDGDVVETMTVGCEGMTGLAVALGGEMSPMRCFTQIAGEAKHISADVFRSLLAEYAELRDVLGRYTQAALHQISQSVACNRLHSVEQRCARWLLMTRDRAGVDEFALTHEFLAIMLGVRRASVTDVEAVLKAKGLIQPTRGRIRITNRAGLEGVSCECYQSVRDDFHRLLALPNDRAGSTNPREAV